jgi:hypothetical protein
MANNMKNTLVFLLLLILITSCNNQYDKAEVLFLEGKYKSSKSILNEIEPSNSNYKKTKLLLRKIDSIYYKKAFEKYEKDSLIEARKISEEIDSESFYYKKRIQLSDSIFKKRDSILYYTALEQYSNNSLQNSLSSLENLNYDLYFLGKKNELSKLILEKIRKNSIKERHISKAVISSIFGASPSVMKVKEEKNELGVFIVSYYSRDAGKSYSYKVKFDNKKAFWGADDGRWRYDKIYYTETSDAYYIIEEYSDGSKRKDKFYKSNL